MHSGGTSLSILSACDLKQNLVIQKIKIMLYNVNKINGIYFDGTQSPNSLIDYQNNVSLVKIISKNSFSFFFLQ